MRPEEMQDFLTALNRLTPNLILTSHFNCMSLEFQILVLNKETHKHHLRIFQNSEMGLQLQNEIISYIGYLIEHHII